jgi:hypothetical protein
VDNRTPSERFWVKVDRRGPDECWPWIAYIDTNGYGGFRFRDCTRGAHRFSYEERYGPIPDDLVVDHHCHNLDASCNGGPTCLHRRCVNPSHLRAVPQRLNLLGSRLTVNSASAAATHCPSGHPYEGDNIGRDGTDRTCRTCKRDRYRAISKTKNAEARTRYNALRAAGLSPVEAKAIYTSKAKTEAALHGEDRRSASLA